MAGRHRLGRADLRPSPVCEVAHAACVGYTLYDYTISDYTHPERLAGAAPKSFDAAITLSAVIGGSVQGFFSFRIYAFSKKLFIPILIWIMALWRLLGCIVLTGEGIQMTTMARYEAKWGWLATVCWSVSTVNDWTITATLVFLLHTRRRTGVHQRTAALVDKLITWSIETGMLTSASSLASLLFFVTMKDNFIWLAVFTVSARLFSNSLLASLNSRTTLRAMNEGSLPLSEPVIAFAPNSVQMTKTTQARREGAISRVQSDG
ncbi:hypothetical protein C8F04DRAFT_1403337, partial [Mycena alexandri]